MQFVLQHRYASASQAAPVCARAGDAGSKNQAVSAIGQEPDAGNRKPFPVALLLCGPAERQREKK